MVSAERIAVIARAAGMRVSVSPYCVVPKIQLSAECPVSDTFRTSFNTWLLERFGTKEVAYVMTGGQVLVGPETYNTLKSIPSGESQ